MCSTKRIAEIHLASFLRINELSELMNRMGNLLVRCVSRGLKGREIGSSENSFLVELLITIPTVPIIFFH